MKFEVPEINVQLFNVEDVITASDSEIIPGEDQTDKA